MSASASLAALAIGLLATSPSSPSPAFKNLPAAIRAEAPADEYFGPLRLSALNIRLRIDALGRAFHARSKSDQDILHDALFLERGLYAWRDRYPHDHWLAPTAFHLEQLYQAIQTPEARASATALLRYIVTYFPATPYGRLSRVRLAQKFPALHGESPLHPTPNPYAPGASPAPTPYAPAASPAPPAATPVAPETPSPQSR